MKKAKENFILTQRSLFEKILYSIVFVFFLIYTISIIFPIVWIIMSSFKKNTEYALDLVYNQPFALPDSFHYENYIKVFSELQYKGTNFLGMMFNSVLMIVIQVVPHTLMLALLGFVVARYDFPGRNLLYNVVIFTIVIPIVGGGGSYFKWISDIHLYDTPLQFFFSSFFCFSGQFLISYAIFKGISWEYAEAVFLDGGGHYTAFFAVILPQALGAMFTLIIQQVIVIWNDYRNPLLMLPSYPTVASGLYLASVSLVRQGGQTLYYAGLMISMIPIIAIYIAFYDTMLKNLSIGGLKG